MFVGASVGRPSRNRELTAEAEGKSVPKRTPIGKGKEALSCHSDVADMVWLSYHCPSLRFLGQHRPHLDSPRVFVASLRKRKLLVFAALVCLRNRPGQRHCTTYLAALRSVLEEDGLCSQRDL